MTRSRMDRIAGLIPSLIRQRLRAAAYWGRRYECTVCERTFRTLLPGGVERRRNVRCPGCDSLERHRLAAWIFQRHDLPPSGARVLHLAPEPALVRLLKRGPGVTHVSADIEQTEVDVHVDITTLPYISGCFDMIYCSHVLEHVPNDRAAMREMLRVLGPRGTALVQVPVQDREKTFEDPTVQSPGDRLRVFGQEDHVRIYGRDVRDRLAGAGFKVLEVTVSQEFEHDLIQRFRLDPDETAFLCTPLGADD